MRRTGSPVITGQTSGARSIIAELEPLESWEFFRSVGPFESIPHALAYIWHGEHTECCFHGVNVIRFVDEARERQAFEVE